MQGHAKFKHLQIRLNKGKTTTFMCELKKNFIDEKIITIVFKGVTHKPFANKVQIYA